MAMFENIPDQLRTSLPAVEKQTYPVNLLERWEQPGIWWQERVEHKIDPYQKYSTTRVGNFIEGAHRDGDQARLRVDLVMHRRAAFRAEGIGHVTPSIAGPHVFLRPTFERDPRPRKPRIVAEGAAAAPLAFQAMTDRNPHRLTLADRGELPAGAFGTACGHGCHSRIFADFKDASPPQ